MLDQFAERVGKLLMEFGPWLAIACGAAIVVGVAKRLLGGVGQAFSPTRRRARRAVRQETEKAKHNASRVAHAPNKNERWWWINGNHPRCWCKTCECKLKPIGARQAWNKGSQDYIFAVECPECGWQRTETRIDEFEGAIDPPAHPLTATEAHILLATGPESEGRPRIQKKEKSEPPPDKKYCTYPDGACPTHPCFRACEHYDLELEKKETSNVE